MFSGALAANIGDVKLHPTHLWPKTFMHEDSGFMAIQPPEIPRPFNFKGCAGQARKWPLPDVAVCRRWCWRQEPIETGDKMAMGATLVRCKPSVQHPSASPNKGAGYNRNIGKAKQPGRWGSWWDTQTSGWPIA